MSKFKVGDKVRILPSAIRGSVSEKAVGKIGEIKSSASAGYFCVLMDYEDGGSMTWAVYPCQMEPVIKIGQQLVFEFMKQ